ncbi:hypothetical protein MRB53_042326 [Persea americana]|nr:hypothetical protein MRB53_042326 [Persea americana]
MPDNNLWLNDPVPRIRLVGICVAPENGTDQWPEEHNHESRKRQRRLPDIDMDSLRTPEHLQETALGLEWQYSIDEVQTPRDILPDWDFSDIQFSEGFPDNRFGVSQP